MLFYHFCYCLVFLDSAEPRFPPFPFSVTITTEIVVAVRTDNSSNGENPDNLISALFGKSKTAVEYDEHRRDREL